MKKTILVTLILFTFGVVNAQKFEAKINPLGAMFGKPDISVEYIVNDNFGVELSAGIAFGKTGSSVSFGGVSSEKPTQSGFGVKLISKYYFSPDQGADGWYGGIYLRQESLDLTYSSSFSASDYKSSIFAGGVEFGKKWVFDSGVLIELALGTGRPFSEKRTFSNVANTNNLDIELGVDFTGKFAVGYRFN